MRVTIQHRTMFSSCRDKRCYPHPITFTVPGMLFFLEVMGLTLDVFMRSDDPKPERIWDRTREFAYSDWLDGRINRQQYEALIA